MTIPKNILDKLSFSNITLFILYIIIFLFYLWTASNGYIKSFNLTSTPNGYHGFLADAFLHGQTSLMIKPSPELLALPNPYDPASGVIRLHDASLYKEQYYLYFSPIIALFILAPFKAITEYFIPEGLLTALMCYIGFLFSAFTLKKILNINAIKCGILVNATCLLSLGLIPIVPFLLRRPIFYELTIAVAYATFMIALYFLVEAATTSRKIFYKASILGFFLGLTILARPASLFVCAFLTLGFLYLRYIQFHENKRVLLQLVISLGAPIICIVLGMLYYNFERFGSLFEFGMSYQLAGYDPQHSITISVANIPLNLYNYIFHLPTLDSIFPFFHATAPEPLYSVNEANRIYRTEPMIGLSGLPVFLLLLIFSCLYLKQIYRRYRFTTLCGTIFFICGIVSMIGTSIIGGCTMRYLVDFTPVLLLSLLLLFTATVVLLKEKLAIKTLKFSCVGFFLTAVISSLVSLSLSITGPFDEMKNDNPGLYYQLKNWFNGVIPEFSIKINKVYPIAIKTNAFEILGLSFDSETGPNWSIFKKVSAKISVDKKEILKHPVGVVSFEVSPFLHSQLKAQHVNIRWGKNRTMFTDVSTREWINIPYNIDDWSDHPLDSHIKQLEIQFNLPDAVAPSQITPSPNSDDQRLLGLNFLYFIVLAS
jgi:hypothetical protein